MLIIAIYPWDNAFLETSVFVCTLPSCHHPICCYFFLSSPSLPEIKHPTIFLFPLFLIFHVFAQIHFLHLVCRLSNIFFFQNQNPIILLIKSFFFFLLSLACCNLPHFTSLFMGSCLYCSRKCCHHKHNKCRFSSSVLANRNLHGRQAQNKLFKRSIGEFEHGRQTEPLEIQTSGEELWFQEKSWWIDVNCWHRKEGNLVSVGILGKAESWQLRIRSVLHLVKIIILNWWQ